MASSSSSSDSSSHHRRKKHKKKKKERKSRHEYDKHKKKKRKSEDKHKRSIITGKRIKRADGAAADADGEARRLALRAAINEGEDERIDAAASAGKRPAPVPMNAAAMMELMCASDAAQRAKKQRLTTLKRGGDDFAGAISREYGEHRGASGGRRTAYDAADYMKPDSGF